MKGVHRLFSLVLLVALGTSLQAATRVWNGGNGLWSDPAGWTPAGAPDPGDEVQINAGTIHLNVPATIGNRLIWNGGLLHSGSLRIAAGASAELGGGGDKLVLNAVFANAGSVRVSSGRLGCLFTGYTQGSVITNEAGGVFELVDTAQVAQVNAGGWPPVALALVNEGTLRKTGAGAGALSAMPLVNRGTVAVESGTLQWTGGGTCSGLFQVPAGAAMTLSTGTYDLTGSRWEGAGPVRIVGSATLLGAFAAENFGLTTGVVGGTFEVSGGFEWTGGSFTGANVRLGPGHHRIAGVDGKELLQASLANAGELVVSGAAVGVRFTGYGQGASMTNEATGTLTLTEGAGFEQRNPGGWPPVRLVFVNAGTLRSSGDATNRVQDIPLNNQGQIEVTAGRLIHRGGGESSGRWIVSAGAVSEWQSGRYNLLEAQVAGPGATVLNGGFTLQGAVSADWFEFQSGSIGGACEVRSGFRWTGGVCTGAALRLGPGEHAITGDHGQTMQNGSLANSGHLVADGAVVGLLFTGYGQSAVVTNEASGVLELRGETRLRQVNPGGWPPVALALVNDGLLRSAGGATNHIEQIPLNNRGTIELVDGVLRQSGGGLSPGKVEIAAAARHEFGSGTYNLNGGRWTGPGAARIVTNSRLLGTFHADNFGLAAGDLDGDFDLSGGFEWTAGRFIGLRARFGPGEHRIHGPADKVMFQTTLANAGHLAVEDGALLFLFTGYTQTVVVTNEPAGVFELVGAARLEQRNPGGWAPASIGVLNEGTFRATGAGAKSIAVVPFHNRGRLEVLDGTLKQTGGGTSPGAAQIGATGRFEFSGGTFQFEGSRWSGPGPVALVGSATLLGDFVAENFRLEQGDISGQCRISGGFHWLGGTLLSAEFRLGPGEHEIAGEHDKAMLNSSVSNSGHLVMGSTTLGQVFTGYGQRAVVSNEAGGELDLMGGARIEQRNGGGWPPVAIGLVNAGVLRKLGDEAAVLAAVPLVNRGPCELLGGALRIQSNLWLEDASQLTVRLGGEPSLEVSGTATLAGRLQAFTAPGFSVAAGATFTPLKAGVLSGRFVNDLTLNPGHVFQYLNGYAGQALSLTAQSQLDQPVELLSAGMTDSQFTFAIRGKQGLRYRLESSTNLIQWQLDAQIIAPADVTTIVRSSSREPGRFCRVTLLP